MFVCFTGPGAAWSDRSCCAIRAGSLVVLPSASVHCRFLGTCQHHCTQHCAICICHWSPRINIHWHMRCTSLRLEHQGLHLTRHGSWLGPFEVGMHCSTLSTTRILQYQEPKIYSHYLTKDRVTLKFLACVDTGTAAMHQTPEHGSCFGSAPVLYSQSSPV